MTTIAYDGKTLAADTASFGGGSLKVDTCAEKIIERSGKIFAFSGTYVLKEPWMQWYFDGAIPEKKPRCAKDCCDELGMWVFDEGRLWQYSPELPYRWEVPAPFAMGSGVDFAMGAFRLGDVIGRNITAAEAVRAAIACDPFTGGDIRVVNLQRLNVEAA